MFRPESLIKDEEITLVCCQNEINKLIIINNIQMLNFLICLLLAATPGCKRHIGALG